jgi:6-phosphogluconolactonase
MHQIPSGFDGRQTKFRPARVRVAGCRAQRAGVAQVTTGKSFLEPFRFGVTALLAAALAACGGGGGGSSGSGNTTPPPPATKYTIGGTASGVTGTGLVLQNNGGDNLAVSGNGTFTFATSVTAGSSYAVTVSTPPSGQTCAVANGSGTANANVTNVSISCTAVAASTVTVGGAVAGLTGTGLVLQDNAGDSLPVSGNGNFTFATALNTGAAYAVTVSTQPSGPAQYCRVTAGTGTASANVTSVAVNCLVTGQFLYTADYSGGKITGYSINPTSGLLTSTGSDVNDGTHPAAVSLAPNGKWAFSASDNGTKIHAFTINPTTGTLTEMGNSPIDNTFFTAAGHPFPDIAVDPHSKFLYLASLNDNLVAGFSIDPTTGSLSPMSQAFPAGSGAGAIPAFSPDGKFLYVMNQYPTAGMAVGDSVSGYSINPTTGELTAIATPWVTGGTNPTWIAFRPDGKFAYVANSNNYNNNAGTGSISVFSVDATGALTAVGTPVTTEKIPSDITLDSSGTHLYVPNRGSHSISQFAIDPTLGTLTPIGSGTATAGLGPILLVIEPTGRFGYVASSYSNDVWGYTIGTDGSLTPMAAPWVTGAAGSDPLFVNVDPSGQFAYTSNSVLGGIVGFTVDQTTGALTPLAGNPYAAPGAPYAVSISPELPGIRD